MHPQPSTVSKRQSESALHGALGRGAEGAPVVPLVPLVEAPLDGSEHAIISHTHHHVAPRIVPRAYATRDTDHREERGADARRTRRQGVASDSVAASASRRSAIAAIAFAPSSKPNSLRRYASPFVSSTTASCSSG